MLMTPKDTLFSLVAEAVTRRVRDADKRNELLVQDWRDTILSVYGKLHERKSLPDEREALIQLIELETDAQVALDAAQFRSRYLDELRSAPDPPQEVLALLTQGQHLAAVDLYRRHSGLGFLVARDSLAEYAEKHQIPTPTAWKGRKRFTP